MSPRDLEAIQRRIAEWLDSRHGARPWLRDKWERIALGRRRLPPPTASQVSALSKQDHFSVAVKAVVAVHDRGSVDPIWKGSDAACWGIQSPSAEAITARALETLHIASMEWLQTLSARNAEEYFRIVRAAFDSEGGLPITARLPSTRAAETSTALAGSARPGSLVQLHVAAADLAHALGDILAWLQWLHRAEFNQIPSLAPLWWKDFEQSDDWRMFGAEWGDETEKRHWFALRKTREIIAVTIDGWDRLWTGFPMPTAEVWRKDDAGACLGVLHDILFPAQLQGRWRNGCVPHRHHLSVEIPEGWSAEPESAEESAARDQIDDLAIDIVLKRSADEAGDRRRIEELKDDLETRYAARLKRDASAKQGRVPEEERPRLIKLRDEWRDVVERWEQAERGIRMLLAYFRGEIDVPNQRNADEYLHRAAACLDTFAASLHPRMEKHGDWYTQPRPHDVVAAMQARDSGDRSIAHLRDAWESMDDALRALCLTKDGMPLMPHTRGEWKQWFGTDVRFPPTVYSHGIQVLELAHVMDGRLSQYASSPGNGPFPGRIAIPVEAQAWATATAKLLQSMSSVVVGEAQVAPKELSPGSGALKADEPAAQSESSASENRFVRSGEIWEIKFGQEFGKFKHILGLQDIAMLIALPHPQQPVAALDLMRADPKTKHVKSSAGPVMSDEAIRGCEERAADIAKEIRTARESSDTPKVESLLAELAEIQAELAGARGLGQRTRRLGSSSPAASARAAVRQRLTTVYQKLRDAQPPMKGLADHLEGSIKTEAEGYAYRPAVGTPSWNQ